MGACLVPQTIHCIVAGARLRGMETQAQPKYALYSECFDPIVLQRGVGNNNRIFICTAIVLAMAAVVVTLSRTEEQPKHWTSIRTHNNDKYGS